MHLQYSLLFLVEVLFSYSNSILLSFQFLSPLFFCLLCFLILYVRASRSECDLIDRFDVAYDCSVELSTLGYQCFTDIYEKFDRVRFHPDFVVSGFDSYSEYRDIGGSVHESLMICSVHPLVSPGGRIPGFLTLL